MTLIEGLTLTIFLSFSALFQQMRGEGWDEEKNIASQYSILSMQ
jgi:hypothetical protein